MRKLIVLLLAVFICLTAQAGIFDIPNLKVIAAYDGVSKVLLTGMDSDMLQFPRAGEGEKQSDTTLVSASVGYLNDTKGNYIYIGGLSANLSNLAAKAKIDYSWAGLQTELGMYVGRSFDADVDDRIHWGVKASIFKFDFNS